MSAPDPFTVAVIVPSALVVWVVLPAAPTEPISWLLHVPGGALPVTAFESLAERPGPVQVSVNVVGVESALVVVLPLVACEPDQPPEAVHEVAFVLVHVS